MCKQTGLPIAKQIGLFEWGTPAIVWSRDSYPLFSSLIFGIQVGGSIISLCVKKLARKIDEVKI